MLVARRAAPGLSPVLLAVASLAACAQAFCGPSSPAAGLEEASRLRAAGRPAEAVKVLAPLAKRFRDDARVRYELASALHAAGRDPDALSEAAGALEADPKSLDARVLHGEILGALRRDQEALQELRQVVAADPGRPGVHRLMGLINARAGRLPQAISQFERELAIHPDDADTLTEIGVVDLQAGRIDEAADVFYRSVPLMRFEFHEGIGMAIRKEVLRRRGAIAHAGIRPPGGALDRSSKEALDRVMKWMERAAETAWT